MESHKLNHKVKLKAKAFINDLTTL